ncbi:TIGR00180 family glycosyltransferase [Allorhodopirellula heiligendammensis]|uniref:Glycosyl transferase family 2 n=1 Tax=Allorhodopirellula heiligendammensis TaxID=2714739 RepID=A0A5C6C003_9BACT|nr:TIGR00180 family glycosyltransferase [Allorhodopirellula heiligendammensis]TWU16524.1 Glycosyl transferase family 2 [Allorhodopirellula heiligendammensis]
MTDDLTLIVPTHNRSRFLRRLLHFLEERRFDADMLIVDSSDPADAAINTTLIHSYSSRLNIQYQHRDCGFAQKCGDAVASVSTPFAVFCADDDFLMPESVRSCVDYLQLNQDYSCASGIWVQVEAHRNNRCSQIRCDQIKESSATRRFQRLAGNWFSNFYSVYRIEPLRRAWQVAGGASEYEDARIFLELMLCHLGAIYGKTAVLPETHYLFELHGQNESSQLPLIANGDRANELYDRFENALARELAAIDGVPIEHAAHTVRSCYAHWRTGAAMRRDYRPTGIAKYRRKLQQSIAKIRDGISNHPTKVWTKRRLRENHRYFQTEAWRSAIDLTARFPDGMSAEQLAAESPASSLKAVA